MKIKAGNYVVRGMSLDMVESPSKKTPGVAVTLRVIEGDSIGETIEWTGWLTDASRTRTGEALAALGYDGEDPETVSLRDAVAVVEEEEWEGRDGVTRSTPRVRWINDPARAGGAKFAALEPARRAQLMGELRGLMMATKKPAIVGKSDNSFDFGANVKQNVKQKF